MRAGFVVSCVVMIAAAGACTLTTSFDGISDGVRPADSGDDAGATGPARVPDRPAGAATAGGGKSLYLGVKHFHFAHSNDALKVPGAWQDWGFDIDGLCTGDVQTAQAGTCIHSPDISAEQVRDGKNCRDNNFGSQIVPLLNVYNDKFENDTNAGLLNPGSAALMFEIDDIGDGVDDPYVPGKLYLLEKMPEKSPPAWDGTDSRAVLPRSVSGGDLKTTLVTFPHGYLRGNVWVSGEPQGFQTAIPIGKSGELMPMDVVHTVISMKLNDGHAGAVDGTGVMAGAVPVSSLESFLRPFLLTQTTFCPGTSQYDIFMKKVATFADVVVAADNLQDPGKSCDGISFGIGFNTAPVAQPTKLGTDPVASTGSCGGMDAGTEGGIDDASSDSSSD
ncbi:MAG: hypothetical protein ACXVEF_17295 [Polyangiales bacterium]